MLPGFPKPEMEALGTTYELLQLQTKTQEWDPGKVSKHSLQLFLILNEGVLIGNIGYQGNSVTESFNVIDKANCLRMIETLMLSIMYWHQSGGEV